MTMTEKEQRSIRSYCAFLLTEYGIHFSPDDPVIPALYVIHKEMQLSNASNKAIASEIKEAAAKINPTVFHFNNGDAAYKFHVGIAIKYILIGFLVLLFTVVGIWYWSMANNVHEAKTIIETSGSIGELMKRVRRDDEGFFVIDFTAAKGDSIQRFTEFQKLDAKTVRIVVGKASE
ncbi:hypothetical protein [Chryseolinea sp. H1M3-3]|uniref:hypothetical protein n=1 Tax=Chryseolinea sp. H1M3-3 TaxID=3034144 RepID=UPI0023EB2F11|nr:hypothetical protein [Chryseolinea sp. H1M3-3]